MQTLMPTSKVRKDWGISEDFEEVVGGEGEPFRFFECFE